MGCGRIITTQDIQQIREARRGMQAGSAVVASGQVGLGLRVISISSVKLQKTVGDIGERITQQSLKGHNLNTTVAPNARIYDVGNQSRVASVKTYGVGHGSVSRSTVSNYVRDLRVATGRSQRPNDMQKFNAAAQELRQAARQSSVPLPSALSSAQSNRSAAEWLRQNAEMRIPDDHVKQVRSAVRSSVIRTPVTYGLPPNASYADKAALGQQLAQRVQPMGMSAVRIEQMVDKYL